jgi:phage shock protein PspC (stress-responsive transcriptional regulator)
VAGVCGGLAHYFAIDPVIIRLLWILFTLAGGGGVLAYLIAWLVVPEEPEGE